MSRDLVKDMATGQGEDIVLEDLLVEMARRIRALESDGAWHAQVDVR